MGVSVGCLVGSRVVPVGKAGGAGVGVSGGLRDGVDVVGNAVGSAVGTVDG